MPTLLIEGRKVGVCDITYNRNDDTWDIHNIDPPVLRKALNATAGMAIEVANRPRKRTQRAKLAALAQMARALDL